jgi:zinc transport system substrate-binding protein
MNNYFASCPAIRRVFILIFILACFSGSFAPPGNAAEPGKINIMVSIPPQKPFVEKIGGEYVNVSILLPPGSSPHSFEPKPSRMLEIGNADIYMAIGVEYEKSLLPKIESMHPGLEIIYTDHGIKKISMAKHGHDQRHRHDHHQHGKDPHVWLSPDLAMIQADNIYSALARSAPQHKSRFQENYINLIRELQTLDQEIKDIFSGIEPGTKFMVFHPAWGYFARSYGLIQVPIEVEGKQPKPADLRQLIDTARHENIRVVFVSPQFSRRSAQVIADSIDGITISINPLAEDWDENMRTVAEKFRHVLGH